MPWRGPSVQWPGVTARNPFACEPQAVAVAPALLTMSTRLCASALSALLLLAACGRETAGDASQVVARVNKGEVSIHQVNQVLKRQPGLQPAQMEEAGRQALERLIEQELAVQKALEDKLDRDPEVMQNLAAARREVLTRAVANKLAGATAQPSPQELQAYFDARPALFAQRRVYALQEFAVQADGPALAALRERVAKARAMSDVTEYLRSEKLPVRASQNTQPAENLPGPLLERLVQMKDGQALLLPAPGGARIVVVLGSQLAPVTLADAKPAIEQAMMTERRRQAVQSHFEAARKASQITYLGKFATPAASAVAAASTAARAAAVASPAEPSASSVLQDDKVMSKGMAGLK